MRDWVFFCFAVAWIFSASLNDRLIALTAQRAAAMARARARIVVRQRPLVRSAQAGRVAEPRDVR